MVKYNFLFLVIYFSLIGCFPVREIPLTDYTHEKLDLPFKVDSFDIVDARKDMLPMGWDVPLIYTKTREWRGNPEFSDVNQTDITQIIRQSEKPNGIPVNLEFRILEGECQLNADWKSMTEYAKFRAEITVEIPSRNYTFRSSAEMYYQNPSLNGTEKGCIRLYNQAVKNVAHTALKLIRDEIVID
jgi:hypothetical protein